MIIIVIFIVEVTTGRLLFLTTEPALTQVAVVNANPVLLEEKECGRSSKTKPKPTAGSTAIGTTRGYRLGCMSTVEYGERGNPG